MKKKLLLFFPILLLTPILSSCTFSLEKYIGEYELYGWREYDVNTTFGTNREELNETYGDFNGKIIINSNGHATFIYSEIYHRDNEEASVASTSNYIRFLSGPIPSDYKFEFKEDQIFGEDRFDCLYYYKSKLVSGFLADRTEHHISCTLRKINKE